MSAPLARVIRSGVVESVHLGSVAVADAAGGLLAWSGDPSGDVFARSCMKPLQAAVSLSFVEEALSEEEVAVMCASHNAETIHLDAVEALLARGGRRAGDLRCPPAWPMDPARAREVEAPESRYHDCSGKHAGMLLACSRAEMDPAGYLDRDHPLHRAVMRAIPDAAGAEPSAIGTDGCGVPVHALPLAGLATMYARLTDPAGLGPLEGPTRAAVGAMAARPYLVAGRDRLCTAVMEAIPRTVVKIGAEGLVCAGLLDRGIGIALKVDDGSSRARAPALLAVLRDLDAATDEILDGPLATFAAPPVLGGGERVGRIAPAVELQRS